MQSNVKLSLQFLQKKSQEQQEQELQQQQLLNFWTSMLSVKIKERPVL